MKETINKIAAGAGRILLKAFVYTAFRPKLIYIDKEVRNSKEPIILIGNHTSHMDGVMTSVIFNRYKSHIIVAKDWYEKKSVNWFLKYNRCIPMDRYNVDTAWLRCAREKIKAGESVIIYPEGRTYKDGIGEFKSGFLMLAIMTGAKVVPYAVSGGYKMFFGARQKVLVGSPVELTAAGKGMTPQYLESESERFRQIVDRMRNTLEEGSK